MPAEEDPAAMDGRDAGSPQQFCLRWNNYQNNLMSCFDQLFQSQSFVDVTIACEGQSLMAHKVVLSACSPYFQMLLMENPCQHPIVIIKDVKYHDLKAAVDFMYRGEINVSEEQIPALLKVAETLKIRGLADVRGEQGGLSGQVPTGGSRGSKRAASPTSPSARRPRLSEERTSVRVSPPPSPPPDQPPPEPAAAPTPHHDDIDIRPGIAEMIREEERARMLENSQAWMGASTSTALAESAVQSKVPRWNESQLHEAIQAVVTQKMRFTQAATHFAIPKGTLYDNILGKSNRMAILEESGITESEERVILEFCCELNVSPYNRRTNKSLKEVLFYVEKLRRMRNPTFSFGTLLKGYRWWWAFCKKNSIVSLYFDGSPAKLKNGRLRKVLWRKTYQYRMQSLWQQCWSTNQNMVHNLRLRERGPLKSWRPETMAEAIFSVLKEGLSLSQAARKYDIPYPTFVLYANRVHNMLGPSADGGADLRPKGRGRPQRILLGVWPDDHIRGVIRAVVFRENHTTHTTHHLRDVEMPLPYPAITDGVNQAPPASLGGNGCGNGREGRVSPNAAAAAAVAAVAHGLRRQMCNMVVAAQRPQEHPGHVGLPPLPMHSPRLPSPLTAGLESPLCSPPPPGHALEPTRPAEPFRPFASPRPDSRYSDRDASEMGPPKTPVSRNGQGASPIEADPSVTDGARIDI